MWRYHGYLRKSAYEGEGEEEGEPTVLLDSAAARLVKSENWNEKSLRSQILMLSPHTFVIERGLLHLETKYGTAGKWSANALVSLKAMSNIAQKSKSPIYFVYSQLSEERIINSTTNHQSSQSLSCAFGKLKVNENYMTYQKN